MLAGTAVTVLGTYSCGDASTGPSDAAVDAGVPADAAIDAGVDAGPEPPPTDAGLRPWEPGWEEVSGLPVECEDTLWARNPGAVLRAEWQPCSDGSAGCWEWEPDVDRFPYWAFRPDAAGRLADGDAWTAMVLDERMESIRTGEYRERRFVLARVDGDALAAWWLRERPVGSCTITTLAGGGDHIVYSMDTAAASLEGQSFFYSGPVEDIQSLPLVSTLPNTELGHSSLQRGHVTPELTAFAFQPRNLVALFSRAGEMRWIPPATGGIITTQQLVGSHVFWLEWGWEVVWAHEGEAGPEVFLQVEGWDVRGPIADETTMAWVQASPAGGRGSDYEQMELWTAPFTTDRASLEPRKVRDLDVAPTSLRGIGKVKMADGAYVYVRDLPGAAGEILFIDLEDGRTRRWRSPERWQPHTPFIYFTGEELVAVLSYDDTWRQKLVKIDVSRLPYVPAE